MHVHVDAGCVFFNFKIAKVLLQNAAVPEMTLCVAFGAFRFGAKFRSICYRSDYATFSTISATAVREVTVCVAFGVRHFGFLVSTWGHAAGDQIGSVLFGSRFRELRS